MLRLICASASLFMLIAFTGVANAQKLDETSRIAILAAFPPEWPALTALIPERKEHEENGVTFATGKIGGRDVVLFLSGIGMVNAAMTTQLALNRFNVEAIVFSGIGGGVDPALSIGDLVIPQQWGSYLHMVIAREDGQGDYILPSIFGRPFANFGMMFPQLIEVRRKGQKEFSEEFWFKVDEELLQIAKRAAGRVNLSDCDSSGQCLRKAPDVVVGGNGVSGSAFVDNADFRKYVAATFKAEVLDMESAAVAQVAFANDVPFIVFRSLSDLAGGGEGANEISTFLGIAAGNAAAMVKAFLEESTRM